MNNTDTNKLINWSEVSRILTGDRTSIKSSYSGKRYKIKVEALKRLVSFWLKWIQ